MPDSIGSSTPTAPNRRISKRPNEPVLQSRKESDHADTVNWEVSATTKMRGFKIRLANLLGGLPHPAGKFLFHRAIRGLGRCLRCGLFEWAMTVVT